MHAKSRLLYSVIYLCSHIELAPRARSPEHLLYHAVYTVMSLSLQQYLVDAPKTAAGLKFLADADVFEREKPYYYSGPLAPEQESQRTNLQFSEHKVCVTDVRGFEDGIRFEQHGFEIRRHVTSIPLSLQAEDDRTVEYMREMSSWLESRFDADLIACYAFRVTRILGLNSSCS